MRLHSPPPTPRASCVVPHGLLCPLLLGSCEQDLLVSCRSFPCLYVPLIPLTPPDLCLESLSLTLCLTTSYSACETQLGGPLFQEACLSHPVLPSQAQRLAHTQGCLPVSVVFSFPTGAGRGRELSGGRSASGSVPPPWVQGLAMNWVLWHKGMRAWRERNSC